MFTQFQSNVLTKMA